MPGHSADALVWLRRYPYHGALRIAMRFPRGHMRAMRSVRVRRAVCMRRLGMRVTLLLAVADWTLSVGERAGGIIDGKCGTASGAS